MPRNIGEGNVGRGIRFRESVSLLLRAEGVENRVASLHKSLASAFDPETPLSDILGIPNFTILTRSEVHRDLSGGVNAAMVAARDDDNAFGVILWERHMYQVGDAYAVRHVSYLE